MRVAFARQKALGVMPRDAQLTERHAGIPAWDDMDPKLKAILERQMEMYTGFMEHINHQVGRLITALEDLGILDDTLVYAIVGDNGASAEGGINGSFNEVIAFNGMADIETPEFLTSKLDEFGAPSSFNHFAVGWSWSMDTPYQWTKQVASHWGGTRNGTIVRWPRGIAEKGGIRNQFCHVIDVAPTILEAAGLPEPTFVNGVMQSPMEGTSMLYTFSDETAAERHDLNTSKSSVTVASITRAGAPSPNTRRHGCPQRRCRRSMTMSGSYTTGARTGPRRSTCPIGCRRSSVSFSVSGSWRRPSTTSFHSTIGPWSASAPKWPGARRSSGALLSSSSRAWDGCQRTAS